MHSASTAGITEQICSCRSFASLRIKSVLFKMEATEWVVREQLWCHPQKEQTKGEGALSPCGLALNPLCCLASLLLERGVGSESKTDDEAKSGESLLNVTLFNLPLCQELLDVHSRHGTSFPLGKLG